MLTKFCTKCKQNKLINEFYKDKHCVSNDGFKYLCKKCYKQINTKRKFKIKLYHKQYNLIHKNDPLKNTNSQIMICTQCHKEFRKLNSNIRRHPKHFCSHSCVCSWLNTHRINKSYVSKLEKYLQKQLIELYPNLEFHFNRRDTLKYELDIYIPSLKLAFEINGICHYKPIYGQKRLEITQFNDKQKKFLCEQNNIKLYIIDDTMLNFKETEAHMFLIRIKNIINKIYSAG